MLVVEAGAAVDAMVAALALGHPAALPARAPPGQVGADGDDRAVVPGVHPRGTGGQAGPVGPGRDRARLVGTKHQHVVPVGERSQVVLALDEAVLGGDGDVRVEPSQPGRRHGGLRLPDVGLGEEHLAVEVGQLHDVAVDAVQFTDAARREGQGRAATGTAEADHGHARAA